MSSKVIKIIEDLNLDGIFIFNKSEKLDPNFVYLLQPKSGIFEYSGLLITKDKKILFTYSLEIPAAKELDVEIVEIRKVDDMLKHLKKYTRIGIDESNLCARLYKRLKILDLQLIDISEELMEIRSIKEEFEIENIKHAIKISEKVLNKILSLDVKSINEKELKAEIEYYAKKFGAEEMAFNTIVAYDENSAIPHYKTGYNNKLPEKVILIDLGIKCNNYCSDITRTFILRKDKEILDAYNIVLEAQEKAIEKIEEGLHVKDVDTLAREIISKKYPKNVYSHSLGHGFGVEIHEKPNISRFNRDIVKNGMVFTIEPGVYFENKFGIRIEDCIRIKNGKAKVLPSFPKETEEILL